MATKKQPPAKKRATFKKVAVTKRAAPKLRRAPAAAGSGKEVEANFAEFFETVGRGLVDAQTRMDNASREYLKGLKGKPYLMPSVFRIPRLTAQMKFAVTKSEKEKFNLIFFGRDAAAETLHQQSVEFEVVSAPPPTPPSELPPFSYEPVFSEAGRAAVFEKIEGAGGPAALLAEPREETLILVNQTGFQYLLIRTGSKPGEVGVWYLIAPEGSPAVLATVRGYGGGDGGGLGDARRAISAEGAAQKAFLDSLK